jgi:hypothetical protein
MRSLLLLLVAACSKDATTDNMDSTETGQDLAVTWHEHVEPLIQKNCASCHGVDGVGGLELTHPDIAQMVSATMESVIAHNEMPPPASDPTCQDYKNSEQLVLTDTEKAVFYDWAEAGSPLGDPANAPAPIDWSQRLSETNATLRLPAPYTVQPNASGNDYHCFVLDNPFEVDTYITGFDVDIDNSQVVHHMLLTIDTEGNAGEGSGDTDLSDGWDCSDRIIESDWSLLHAWTPGMAPVDFGDEGMKVEPGDQIILQMHYFQSGSAEQQDQSAYALKTTESVDRQVMMYPYGPTDFKIPAGEEAHSATAEMTNPYADLRILGVFPHMHWLGTGYASTISNTDGEQVACLAQADRYDFDFQSTFMFKEPVVWKLGDTVHTTCTWDNSEDNPNQFNDPPEDIGFGEGTNEEMCFFLYYFTLN